MNRKRQRRHSLRLQLRPLENRCLPAGLNGLVSIADSSLYAETAGGRLEYDTGASPSSAPSAVSADGRFVTFTSKSGNLVAGQVDNNADYDVFLFDRLLQTTTLVSRTKDSQTTTGRFRSIQPSISGDGRFVAFISASQDLALNTTFPTNNLAPSANTNVYFWDRATGATQLVSHRFDDVNRGSSYRSYNPTISANGQRIVFTSTATDLVSDFSESGQKSSFEHFYVYDFELNSNSLVDHKFGNSTAATTITNSLFTIPPRISDDGKYVVFQSLGTDLMSAVIPSVRNIYRHAVSTGINEIVTNQVGSETIGSNSFSGTFNMTPDGRWIVFASTATNLVENYSGSSYQVYVKNMASGVTELVSHQVGNKSAGGNGQSAALGITTDGKHVSMLSDASDLMAGFIDGNGPSDSDAFLYDRQTGDMSLVSRAVGTTEVGGNGRVFHSMITASGDAIFYSTRSTNAIAGFSDGNIEPNPTGGTDTGYDLFAYYPDTEETKLVSSRLGTPTTSANAQVEFRFEITTDGKNVVYASAASDIILGLRDNNGAVDVFHRDLVTNTATLISRSLGGPSLSGGGMSNWVQVNADGRYVVFTSTATNLVPGQVDVDGTFDVFLRDRILGTTTLISRAVGTTATTGNDQSGLPVISADGRFIAFGSYAGNLIAGFVDNNGPSTASQGLYNNMDLFLYDRLTDNMTLVSREVGTTTIGANGTSGGFNATNNTDYHFSMSADGNWITYRSNATNLVSGFVNNDVSGSADQGTNVYLFDRMNQTNRLVSHIPELNTGGGNRRSYAPRISGDGRFITYWGESANLVAGMTFGGGRNVFLYDRDTDTNVLVSHAAVSPTQSGNGGSSEPIISQDGRFVVFISAGNNLLSDQVDTNNQDDVFIFDRMTGVNTLISHAAGVPNQAANDYSDVYGIPNNTAISADGRFVTFNSTATNVVAGFVLGVGSPGLNNDVYLYDRLTNSSVLVSHGHQSPTTGANRDSFMGSLSADGRFVYFFGNGDNVIEGFTSQTGSSTGNMYVYDRVTNANRLVSHMFGTNTSAGNGQTYPAAMSADGSVITFISTGDIIAPGDFNGFADTFAYANAPEAKVLVNDGSSQRSVIRSLTITFDQPISFLGDPSTAFVLNGSPASLLVSGASEFTTSVTITFNGSQTQFGSLADGNYALQIIANKIIGGGRLDGNGDGIGGDDFTITFHRLFGDVDGDRKVNYLDFYALRGAFSTAASAFDFNNDGIVNATDFAQFRARFGIALTP